MQQAELPQPNIPSWESVGTDWARAMAEGDFPAAWRANDGALALRRPEERDDPAQPYHLRWVWDGTPVDGRDVLVRCYHGLGDTLQFCRYLPALRARAAQVTLEVQAELMPLVALAGGADRMVPFDPAAPCPVPPGGLDLEIMELAHALRIAPVPVPYLPIARTPWPGTLQVGLCWHVHAGWRPQRSIPAAEIGILSAVPDAALHSLQKGAALPGMAACPDALEDTARVIAGLGLVITVDTMVAHLAGAIGVPVWLLLDASPDWRWQAGGRGSPWYRGIRKYAQSVPSDWGPPLRAVAADLTRLASAGTVDV